MQRPPGVSSAAQQGHHFANASAHDRSNLVLGDVYNYGTLFSQDQESDEVKAFGLCLGSAPLIERHEFVGRAVEIDTMTQILQPADVMIEQRRLVLGGMGGIGKTQLAIAYAQRCRQYYTSVFWFNATSELTLKTGFRSVARQLLKRQEIEKLDDEQVLGRTIQWLSDTMNTQWLLIFDNYDDPDQFNLGDYCPNAGHGAIIITTRLPDLVSGHQVRVQPLRDIEESLSILQTRSRRDRTRDDLHARRLAERLGGLPLALATAGVYLRKSTFTFQRYLEEYEQRWNIDPRRPLRLIEYQNRTQFTTWDLSYTQLESSDPEAAQALKLLAYFDNQHLWYEHFQAGVSDSSPQWLHKFTASQVAFESVMRTLVDFCLVDVHTVTQSYSIHSCVHDWILAGLNMFIDTEQYWYAFDCVANSISPTDREPLSHIRHARLTPHAVRLTHERFIHNSQLSNLPINQAKKGVYIAHLLQEQVQLSAAAIIYTRVLASHEKLVGPDHTSTLNVVNNFGLLYRAQGKTEEAKRMYTRALAGREKALGPDNTLTLDSIHCLANIYHYEGRVEKAEQMYERALAGYEKALGPDHASTLLAINNLGLLYRVQDKFEEAKRMYTRALAGREKALGPDHTLTLDSIQGLANIYRYEGRVEEAEQMCERALAGYEKALGPDHASTLLAINNLGLLYRDRDKLEEAKRMHTRALAGGEKALGPDHYSTLHSLHCLADLYCAEVRLDEAEHIYERALVGHEKSLGPDHASTLLVVHDFGYLYFAQNRLNEAEQMLERAHVGFEKVLGPDHTSTLLAVNSLGFLYQSQGKLADAEKMHTRALVGREKTLGRGHKLTLETMGDLSNLYRRQGKIDEAEQLFQSQTGPK